MGPASFPIGRAPSESATERAHPSCSLAGPSLGKSGPRGGEPGHDGRQFQITVSVMIIVWRPALLRNHSPPRRPRCFTRIAALPWPHLGRVSRVGSDDEYQRPSRRLAESDELRFCATAGCLYDCGCFPPPGFSSYPSGTAVPVNPPARCLDRRVAASSGPRLARVSTVCAPPPLCHAAIRRPSRFTYLRGVARHRGPIFFPWVATRSDVRRAAMAAATARRWRCGVCSAARVTGACGRSHRRQSGYHLRPRRFQGPSRWSLYCVPPADPRRAFKKRPWALMFGLLPQLAAVMAALRPCLRREYFGARIHGTMFGAVNLASTLGMGRGPLAGGWALRRPTALFSGSTKKSALRASALGAVAIALDLRPPPPQPWFWGWGAGGKPTNPPGRPSRQKSARP